MKSIYVLLFTPFVCFSCSEDNRPLENPDYIQLRMVRDSYREGSLEYEDPIEIGKSIQLQEEVLLNLSHVKRAMWLNRDNREGFDVWVELNDEGTVKWSNITRDNKEERVAVLVDGTLIMAPTIMAQITDGRIPIFFDLPEEDGRSWTEKIGEQLRRYR